MIRPRAFTVTEMVVAAAVFITAVLVLFGIFPISARSVSQSEQRLMAVHLASSQLELARAINPERLRDEGPYTTTVRFLHQGKTVTQEYSLEQRVTPATANAPLRNVTVVVSWHADNRDQQVQMETQFARLQP